MANYPNLDKFLEKYRLALQNKSKEIRYTMLEMNDVVQDIHNLQASVEQKFKDLTELNGHMVALLGEIKALNSTETDAGKF